VYKILGIFEYRCFKKLYGHYKLTQYGTDKNGYFS
jgi:hypothetical protein